MGRLNKDNFLVWDGKFKELPFTVIAGDKSASAVSNAPSITLDPFTESSATFGINYLSFRVISQPIGPPVTYNSITHQLTYIIPPGSVPGTKEIVFDFTDVVGNLSNQGTITITLTPRPTGWRANPASFSCLQESGENTGYGFYALLEEYYIDDNTAVSPLNTKENDSGDPDYVPSFADSASCPIADDSADMTFIVSVLEENTIVDVSYMNDVGDYIGGYPVYAYNSTPRTYDVPYVPDPIKISVNVGSLAFSAEPYYLTFQGNNTVTSEEITGPYVLLEGCQLNSSVNSITLTHIHI